MATPVFLPGESPWTEKPGGLLSMGLQRVGHDWLNTCRVLKICRVLFPAYSIKHNLGTAVKITTPFFSFFNDTISVGEKKKSLQMLLFHNRSLTADCLELGVQENGRKKACDLFPPPSTWTHSCSSCQPWRASPGGVRPVVGFGCTTSRLRDRCWREESSKLTFSSLPSSPIQLLLFRVASSSHSLQSWFWNCIQRVRVGCTCLILPRTRTFNTLSFCNRSWRNPLACYKRNVCSLCKSGYLQW